MGSGEQSRPTPANGIKGQKLPGRETETIPLAFRKKVWIWIKQSSMDELRSAMEKHVDQMADLVQKLSAELRSGIRPAYDNFIGFFHAIDWKVLSLSISPLCLFLEKVKETKNKCARKSHGYVFGYSIWFNSFFQQPWLLGLLGFHFLLLLTTIISRKNLNFQMFLFVLACKFILAIIFIDFQHCLVQSYSNEIATTFWFRHWWSISMSTLFVEIGNVLD